MTNTDRPDRLVERAARRASYFADAARAVEGNTVTERTEEERLFEWMPLTRTYHVSVVDRTGRGTDVSWSVALEVQPGRRRSIRFFGWGYSAFTSGRKISEGIARIRVTV